MAAGWNLRVRLHQCKPSHPSPSACVLFKPSEAEARGHSGRWVGRHRGAVWCCRGSTDNGPRTRGDGPA